jgi:hypothetical protein
MLLFPLADITRALRPGDAGSLALLGAGALKISRLAMSGRVMQSSRRHGA